MVTSFINSFESEWIKRRRSLASWIVIIGAFFTPTIIIVARLINQAPVAAFHQSKNFWANTWRNSWESMAIFLLPVGLVLATSLITQLEYKNNTWKQVHTTPLSFTVIFLSKLSVILVMLVQFFFLFNTGIFLTALLPSLLISGVSYPPAEIPYMHFLTDNALYMVDCLPVIALQYLLSLQYRNFLVPIGAGFLVWIASIGLIRWKFGFIIPYTYCMYHFLGGEAQSKIAVPPVSIHWLAVAYAVFFLILGYAIYINKKEKG